MVADQWLCAVVTPVAHSFSCISACFLEYRDHWLAMKQEGHLAYVETIFVAFLPVNYIIVSIVPSPPHSLCWDN